jgi:transcriptional regulator with XRE-family HTH domain
VAKTSKTAGRRALAKQREALVIKERIEGYSFQQIADKLGMSSSGAISAYERGMAVLSQQSYSAASQARELWNQRIELWLSKLKPQIDQGEVTAINAAKGLCERACKINGLDYQADDTLDTQQRLVDFIKIVSTRSDALARAALIAEDDRKELDDGKTIEASFEDEKKA